MLINKSNRVTKLKKIKAISILVKSNFKGDNLKLASLLPTPIRAFRAIPIT